MGIEVLKKFDRYLLLDCIAQGGMAEIFRARIAGPEGAARFVVIKRILANYGRNQDFRAMFKSEIRVMMGFNHPNIVQLYDFGEATGQPFIAMELVDGKNLRQLISRAYSPDSGAKKVPIEYCIHIAKQAAAALHYAHAYRDKMSGDSLEIVHRDVSPQNILVSFEGNIKIIDFGIAKMASTGDMTKVGVIKGKPSYLAPEQVTGQKLDGRSDVFSLGTVLWEMLTGRKLFAVPKGESEFAVLKLIESCQSHVKPPSELNPEVPKDLDYIVLKALAKDRDKRYQSAEEFQRALHKLQYQISPDFNPGDVGYFVKELFKDEIVEDRKILQKLAEKAERLVEADVSLVTGAYPEQQAADSKHQMPATAPADSRTPSRPVHEPGVEINIKEARGSRVEIEEPTGTYVGGVGRGRTRAGVGRSSSGSRREGPYRSLKSASGWGTALIAAAGVALAFVYFSGSGRTTFQKLSNVLTRSSTQDSAQEGGPRSSPQSIESRSVSVLGMENIPAIDPSSKVVLHVRVKPDFGGSRITINHLTLDAKDPRVRVPVGKPLELVVVGEGFNPLRKEFTLSPAEYSGKFYETLEVTLDPVQYGYLSISSTPSADAVIHTRSLASGTRPWTIKTPVDRVKLPVGIYSITLENTTLGMSKRVGQIEIESGKTRTVEEKLEIHE